jgi:hypothetical protein
MCLITNAVINNKLDCTFVYSLVFGYYHQADQSFKLIQLLSVLCVQPTQQFLMLCIKNHKLLWLQTLFKHEQASECIQNFLIQLIKTEFQPSIENQVFCKHLADCIEHFEPEIVMTMMECHTIPNHFFAKYMLERYQQIQSMKASWIWDLLSYSVRKLYQFSHSISSRVWKLIFNKQI